MAEAFPIEPSSKVGELLEHYPELEDVLIGMAPPFKKLKNPLLRKSVGKVATLRQAAAVGRISVEIIVNRLRAEVGQEPTILDEAEEGKGYFTSRPEWFDITKVGASIDESHSPDSDEMTLNSVTRAASHLGQGEILELITTFLPAPGIDIMREKGFLVWPVQEEPKLVKTYFYRP
ncbi:MAG: DUF1858 domain-containing protein [Nitrospinaceae bacterium]|jgi:hypothetical protein|nr:DUF1858 domain-containing protein [Nitrospinaceae bacterium]MBT3433771.1 DUF1858 domain-containing protein [Nitrospinaceae bacterium]MBT3822172.1 DUF1858 domain-containing protein [Nitrospinaceae bacterium]MBT4431998.1 DUF1858 domain-containing protein [Nitrospinaceae bacterium]MBT5366604.1 DUF1858 domain-containing protein [Nitrospinaceae bacterium]